ncbi:mucin-6 isoform X9 [Corvus hawaiiensis]|uniref:mucin-6 isoform X9 n=1 Tax=Corvus hawaiiensis TaxID=134902 RepID=UPI002019E21E|nr:mucin-6 isoform X9 [Corvus hawaiiensis]
MLPTLVLLIFCSFLQSAAFEGNYWSHVFLQNQKESLQRIRPSGQNRSVEEEYFLPTVLSKDSCSTWGGGHFSTFDKYQYDFTGTCNYIFATVCDETSPDFNIQFRRGLDKKIARIIIELGPSVVIVEKGSISVRSVGVIQLPYTSNGIQIAPYGRNIRLVAKLMEMELVVMWNNDDYLMVLAEKKYMGKTCGMCGNYDGYELNEFVREGKLLDTFKFAALQKMDDPSEICLSEEIPISTVPHKKYAIICSQLLNLVSPTCSVPKDGFVIRCQLDMQDCSEPGQNNCTCSTLSEYSRQCAMSHQMVFNWRTENFCSVGKCSANLIYEECGSPCIKTCSNPEYSCSSHCTYGCFCPEGTVLDDISKNRTCVHISQCPCTLNGKTYAPGETMKAACRTCKCVMGQWNCKDLPCPGRCSLEGGSFVTTFDSRPYRFHGVCTYVLMKSSSLPHNGTLMAVYEKTGYSHSETSLSAIIYQSTKDKIVISQNDLLTDDDELKRLPYRSGDITVFRQSSMYVQMHTNFGLELAVQTSPVFQAYVKVGSQFKGRTLGLCGNYNGDTTDDFMTSMDITEGTASLFVDSWRAGNCHPALERETDPCALSQLNKISAETHCSILTKKGTVFEKCHAVVNPIPFYKRCVYQACNYEETFPYICSALGSYARVCSSMGLVLENWRSSMDNCTITCTGNQTFSYNTQACDRTCLSLSNRALECHPTDIPVEGCQCPKGTYLNHKSECVRKSHCPCYLEDRKYILPDQSTITGGITCYCVNGRLSCTGKPQNPAESCKAPKKYISCSDSLENKYGAACAPTCQMLATGIECIPTKCESGCVCADGLYENLDGGCVPAEECPCEYGGLAYGRGEQIQTECEICTCMKGKWKCVQKTRCSSTCNLYGEGHITTFDGQRFVFDGNCEYILAMDGCSVNRPVSSFKIVTENVICGKSGVTCSRSISIYLGNLTIILRDETFAISGENPGVQYKVKKNALHLMFDVIIPGKYNMTLIWNKHMNFFIKISRETQETICGLCGNYNGNMKDDFETRSKYVASNELEFVNSWKENPLCGDVYFVVDPCSKNPYRKAWAEKTCSIINSHVFSACHNKVNRMPYYEACVRDSCGCDIGGDCQCMCDAIAVYAMVCLEKGVCIDWRTPEFCPVYCEYYNSHTRTGIDDAFSHGYNDDKCAWHYRPCNCPNQNYKYVNIEGCYNCSHDEYFDHEEERCMPCGQANITTTPEPSSPSPVTTVQPKVTRSSTTSTLPTGPSTSSTTTVATETTNPTITAKITVPRTSPSQPLVTIKSTTEHTTSIFTTPNMTTTITAPSITTSMKRTMGTTPKSVPSSPAASSTAASTETEQVRVTSSPFKTTKKEMATSSIPTQTTTFSQPKLTTAESEGTQATTLHYPEVVTHIRTTLTQPVQHLVTQTQATPATSTSSTSVPRGTSPATSPGVPLTRTFPSSSSLPVTLASSAASLSSTQLRTSYPAAFTHEQSTVPHIVPPLSTHKTTATTSISSTSRTSVSTEVPLETASPHPSSPPAPSSPLSTRLPSTATTSTVSSTAAPGTSLRPTPTTLRPKSSSPTTSAPKESPVTESSAPTTAKTSTLPSPASSPFSTVSSAWLSSSQPAAFTHEQSTVPYIVPPLSTHKTTATTSISSTSRTSVSTEVPLETASPHASSPPAPSSPLSTRLPSTATTSTVSSTAAPGTSLRPTPTTLRPKPSSPTTSAPKESPVTESSAPTTAKTSTLPSPASSPFSTVSSAWLSSSQPAAFTHEQSTVPHIVPPLSTHKTTATTSISSTSRTSVSTEVPLETASPHPSSPPAPSSPLSTRLPSTATTSTVSSTAAPGTSLRPTPTTLRPKPSSPTTSAPKESPVTESSAPTTAKTSTLPSPASSPFSTVSSTWLSSSQPAFTHKILTVPHVVPPLSTHKTTATTSISSTSRTSVSTEVPLETASPHPSSPPAPSSPLSTRLPSTATTSTVSSTAAPGTSPRPTPTTLRPKPSSPTTSAPKESPVTESSAPTTAKTSTLPSPASSPFSTVSSAWLSSSQPAAFTHEQSTVPHIVPPLSTHKTTATTSISSTSRTSVSTEVPLETASPHPSSPPAPSSPLSTRLPSTATTSTVSSTAAPGTSPRPTPTTLRPKPSSPTTSAPKESPVTESSALTTAKTSTLPSPASSPFSTVSSTWLSSSQPAFTHKILTVPHVVPPLSTHKTTATTSISSTSRTSVSTEVPLETASPHPSSPPAPSSPLSTRLPSTATTSTVSSTAAPGTSLRPTPTTLRPKSSSPTTSAPKESPVTESSAPTTAKTSTLPSPASSPFSTVSSAWLSSSQPAAFTHEQSTVPHIVPPLSTHKTTATTSISSTSRTSVSTEVPLETASPHPSSPPAPSSPLSTRLPSTATTSTVSSTAAPGTSPRPTPTTLRPKPSSPTTSAPKESPVTESSALTTAKTSTLPSPASSPFSTVSSTWLSSSQPAFTHKILTVPHVVPPLSTHKTTATTSISSTSRTSVSTEVPLETASPHPSSPPAPSSPLSTRLPSTATTSTVSSTAAPGTSPRPTPTTLRPKPSSPTTSAPKESPVTESSAPTTAKTSTLPSPASSPFSTVSSAWLSSSQPAAFTHEQSTVPHIVPPLSTHKTTATTSISSTSRTSVSTEVPLETASPHPSSPPAPSSPLSTRLPSTATTSTVSSTAAPGTSPRPTSTTLRPKPSSPTTSAPKESPVTESSAPTTAKTSTLPSPASSPFSTVSSTWLSSSQPAAFTHEQSTVPHIVPPLSTHKTTATTSISSTSRTSVSTEVPLETASPHPSSPPAPSSPLSTRLPSTATTSTVSSTAAPGTSPRPTPTTLRPKPSSPTTSPPKESPVTESSALTTAKTSTLPSPASSLFSTVSSTWLSSSQLAFTHGKSTVPHVAPPLTTHKTRVTTFISSTSKTSVSTGSSPPSSTEVPLETASPHPSSPPAPSGPLSTRLPSAAPSPFSSALAPTVSTMSVPTPLPTSAFRSAESTTHSYFQNTTSTPYGKTSSLAVPTSISAQSSAALIPAVLSTTITFAPHVITTASTESVERSSLQTTTLTTARTTSSPPLTSGLATSLSSVVPSTVPHERCREVEYEEEITYKGCSTNVTLSQCEGSCPSSTKLDVEKMMVTTACGCCRPRELLKKEFQLPCQDPDNPGKRLTTEIIAFSGCVCNFDSCTH